ncbi:MAG: TraI domain-containing protein [Candidatus Accumulibacter similis]|nr:MAG: TraI domain-containing protein [Candidatus Accumulibacter similis]
MFGFLKRTVRSEPSNPPPVTSLPANTPAEALLDDEIPRYPPFMKGLPATHPDKLIETQRELIGQIRETGVATPEIFAQFHLAALRRFASYAHLLPASQTHHHRGAGGLLRHATEVALWSLQSGDRLLLPGEQTPRRRRELEPRWHLAVFLSALCHDLGKPVTDLVVTSRDGAEIWNPFIEDLHAWATRHRVDRYFLHWRDNRGRKHQAVSALIAERIIGAQGLAWLAEGDTDLVLWMMESINGSPSAENPMHDLVVRSDQVSVERDLRSLGVAFTGYEIGLPVERFLLDLMRRLVREGTWTINRPGARLWCIDGQLYLVWPAAGEELAALIHQEAIPGLPRTPDSLLEMLVDRSLASVREDRGGGEGYWQIAPAVLAEKIPNIRLTTIRLGDSARLIEPPPPSVPGRLLGDKDPAATVPQIPEPLGTVPEPLPPVALGGPPDPDGNPQQPPDRQPPAQPLDRLDGAVGEALQALARDLQSGKRSAATLTHVDPTGILCLKWPDAFDGCGLQSKAILEELSHHGWLALDPLSPFRKVTEIAVASGEKWRVVRLQPAVSRLMAIGKPARPVGPTPIAEPFKPPRQPRPVPHETDAAGADERLALIRRIVATLRAAIQEGLLTPEADGPFVWLPSRKAESLLTERLQLERTKILRLGAVVPDVFLCQTRNRVHCYRIPAAPAGERGGRDPA